MRDRDVVRETLRLLQERDHERVAGIEELRHEIEVGLAQLRRGEGVDGESFFGRIAARRRRSARRT
jgi:antitoxin ParD1/3/4